MIQRHPLLVSTRSFVSCNFTTRRTKSPNRSHYYFSLDNLISWLGKRSHGKEGFGSGVGMIQKQNTGYLNRENRVRAPNGDMEIGRSEGDKVCEWTQYDEEAEQDEVKRKERRDLDLNLQIVGPNSIAWMFGGMSLSNNGEQRRPLAEPSRWKA